MKLFTLHTLLLVGLLDPSSAALFTYDEDTLFATEFKKFYWRKDKTLTGEIGQLPATGSQLVPQDQGKVDGGSGATVEVSVENNCLPGVRLVKGQELRFKIAETAFGLQANDSFTMETWSRAPLDTSYHLLVPGFGGFPKFTALSNVAYLTPGEGGEYYKHAQHETATADPSHCYVLTYDPAENGTVKAFVDGVKHKEATWKRLRAVGSSKDVILGEKGNWNGQGFEGLLFGSSVRRGVMSEAEITAKYQEVASVDAATTFTAVNTIEDCQQVCRDFTGHSGLLRCSGFKYKRQAKVCQVTSIQCAGL